jgi:hypothetical protein
VKTPERALTEWACDEILFDYMRMGLGPVIHTRAQFEKIWGTFRWQPDPEKTLFNTAAVKVTVGDGTLHVTEDWMRGVVRALKTYRDVRYGKVRTEEIHEDIQQFFDTRNLILFETAQEVINALMEWKRE